jgi:hypothetical protein
VRGGGGGLRLHLVAVPDRGQRLARSRPPPRHMRLLREVDAGPTRLRPAPAHPSVAAGCPHGVVVVILVVVVVLLLLLAPPLVAVAAFGPAATRFAPTPRTRSLPGPPGRRRPAPGPPVAPQVRSKSLVRGGLQRGHVLPSRVRRRRPGQLGVVVVRRRPLLPLRPLAGLVGHRRAPPKRAGSDAAAATRCFLKR